MKITNFITLGKRCKKQLDKGCSRDGIKTQPLGLKAPVIPTLRP